MIFHVSLYFFKKLKINIMFKIIISTISLVIFSSQVSLAKMKLKSDDFRGGRTIPEKHAFNGFGCTGDNLMPQLNLINIPANTKSLALTIYDPDAPTQSGWWHLVAYNIKPSVSIIKPGFEGMKGVAFAKNDYGTFEYGGPCPPVGTKHQYRFTLYALNVDKLDVPDQSSAALVSYNLEANAIKKAVLTGYYYRKRQSK